MNLLKFVAVIAVVNSHLDFFYPKGYEFLATGGAIGNALFFVSSGFGLWFSVQKLNDVTFIQWFSKRCLRIYPSYLVVLPFLICLLFFIGKFQSTNIIDIGGIIFFPDSVYWFLQAIILYYILIYYIFSHSDNKESAIYISIFLSFVSYFYFYFFIIDLSVFSIERLPFNLIFYFICLLLGMVLSARFKGVVFSAKVSLLYIFLSLLVFFMSKFAMLNGRWFEFQFLQHITILSFVFSLFSLSRTSFNAWLRARSIISKSIDFISAHTLEIYLVHLPLVMLMEYLDFNNTLFIIPLVIITLIISFNVKKVSCKLMQGWH